MGPIWFATLIFQREELVLRNFHRRFAGLLLSSVVALAAGTNNSIIEPAKASPVAAASEEKLAGPGELVSDRPDFTESTEVVARGYVQLETGMVGERSGGDSGTAMAFTVPQPLARIGLTRKVELRIAGDGYQWQRNLAAGDRLRGASDPSFGAKVKLAQETKRLPAIAVIGAVSTPIGHRDFTSYGYDPEVKICWSKAGPGGFAASGNVNFSSVTDAEGRLFNRAVSFSVGHDLPAGFGGYWEWYDLSLDRGLGHSSMFNMGITRSLGPDAQVDFLVGHTMSGNLPGWFSGMGLVIRRPLGMLVR